MSGALAQAAKDAGAVLSVVRGGSRIVVDQPLLERAVDGDRELRLR